MNAQRNKVRECSDELHDATAKGGLINRIREISASPGLLPEAAALMESAIDCLNGAPLPTAQGLAAKCYGQDDYEAACNFEEYTTEEKK